MDDLISRAVAIEAVYYKPSHKMAIEVLKELPAIDAIPVEWLDDRANDITRAPLYRRYAQMLIDEWQKEQEAHGT